MNADELLMDEGDLEDFPDPLAEAIQPLIQQLQQFAQVLAKQTDDQQRLLAMMAQETKANSQAVAQALQAVAQAASKPKTIKRGPDGRAIGIE